MKNPTPAFLLLAVLLSSCNHYYYVANIQPVPLFKEKDELRFSVACAGGDESTCFEVQTAYSLTDHLGIMANYMHAKGGNEKERDYGKGDYIEGAMGYFLPFEKYGVFEVYGGFGGGRQVHEYSPNDDADISLTKLFIQPSFGLTHDIVDIALSARLCHLSFSVDNNLSPDHYDYDDLNAISGSGHFFLEPAITLRAGWKNIKGQLQFCYVAYLGNPRIYIGEEVHVSIGLYFTLANRLKQDTPDL